MAEALLERDDELSELAQLVSAAVAGRGGLVYIRGPAGIGKSQLITALLELADRSGVRVLSARGGELERDFGTGVVRQLFEQLIAGAPVEQRRAWFAGAAALAGPLFDATDGVPAGGVDEQAVLHGLYWLSTNLALERPLLIAVDDAHWADPPSMRFIAYLARRTAGSPILVAVAARPTETDADRRLLATIAAHATAVLARSRGSLLAYARVSCFRAFFRHRLGALDDSEADAKASLDAAGDSGWPIAKMTFAIMIDVLVERGRLDESEQLLVATGVGAACRAPWPRSRRARGWSPPGRTCVIPPPRAPASLSRRGSPIGTWTGSWPRSLSTRLS